MSSLQSLREFISERLAAAAEEIFRHCEGTIVQYEEELCRQRRLLDIEWKPQLQLHQIVLPQHLVTEEKDLCNQQINFRVEQNNPEPPQIKEEQEEQDLPQVKEEQEGFSISQDEDQLDLKQETDTSMEIPTNEENEPSEADLNNQQSFNVTATQDEGKSQHEESTSTTDGETDQQNRDQRKRKDRSHVQSVASSHMSGSQCNSDVREKFMKASLGKECKQPPKEKKLSSVKSDESSRMLGHRFVYMRTESDERLYVCRGCRTGFYSLAKFRFHMQTQTGCKPFSCKECNRSFSQTSVLKTHMRTHTGEKPFTCKECNRGFSKSSNLKRHMRIHT